MAIKSDYLLDMVARFFDAVLAGHEKTRLGAYREAIGDYEGVVAGVLDMGGTGVLELSSDSLVTMMRLSSVDEALAVYCVYALMRAAEQHDALGSNLGDVRRGQAAAIAADYGFSCAVTPSEVSEALSAQGF